MKMNTPHKHNKAKSKKDNSQILEEIKNRESNENDIKLFSCENELLYEFDSKSNKYIVKYPWKDSSLKFEFDSNENFSLLRDVHLPNRLIAIKHPDCYEFIYQPVRKEEVNNYKSFKFCFEGKEYNGMYCEPSEAFVMVAKSIRRVEYEETNYTNVFIYRAFYNGRLKGNSDSKTLEYKPLNFFLYGDFGDRFDETHIKLFRHINFYLKYYVRKSPVIFLANDSDKLSDQKITEPNLRIIPPVISASPIDETLLLLLESARNANAVRLKYIFYYQILEYCSYYYLEDTFKKDIHNIIESPSFFIDINSSINLLIEKFQDNYNTKQKNDTNRLEKVILTYCPYDNIKSEIAANQEYFRKECKFDGGFKLKPLLSNNENIDQPSKDIMKTVKTHIENLRNVLVHVRESRESRSIAPTNKNTDLLKPYLYLIQRIAEEVATRKKDN